jgi:chromosome segregation ATPase
MNSKALASEIEGLRKNRARLQSELESAEEAHAGAREGLVQAGDKQTVDDVTAAHARVSPLREAIANLDVRIEKVQEQLQAAKNKESEDRTWAETLSSLRSNLFRPPRLAVKERGVTIFTIYDLTI